jgi:hypothetical protein
MKLILVEVDLETREVTMEDGTTLEITNIFDIDGEETEDLDEAVACVAGNDDFGWVVFAVERETATVH